MREVAVAAVVGHLDVFAKVVEITPDLFEGLPWSESDLRTMRGRVDWDSYAVLLDRLGERCKHDEVIRAVGATMDETGPWLALLLQTVTSPVQLVQFWERMIPKLWRAVRVRHAVLRDGSVVVNASLLEGHRGCRTMFIASTTAVATSTRRIGLPPMEIVSYSTSDRHGTYLYRLPPSKTVPHRLMEHWDGLLEFLSLDEDPPEGAASLARMNGDPCAVRNGWAQDAWALTSAQTRVLELIVRGHTNKEVARALSIEEGTVESHVGVIFRKARAANRTMLVYRYWMLEVGVATAETVK